MLKVAGDLRNQTTDDIDLVILAKHDSEDDVYNVAAYMLVAPRLDERWGGTIYF